MQRLIIMMLLSSFCITTRAQETQFKHHVHVSYLGHLLTQPGIGLGYSHEVWNNQLLESKKLNKKKKEKSVFVLYQTGFSNQHRLSTLVPVVANLGYSRTRPKGWKTTYIFGMGYQRTFLKGTTYTVTEEGKVSKSKLVGSGYFMNNFGIAFGKDLSKISDLPISISLKNSLWLRYQQNSTTLPQPFTEIEITYHLK